MKLSKIKTSWKMKQILILILLAFGQILFAKEIGSIRVKTETLDNGIRTEVYVEIRWWDEGFFSTERVLLEDKEAYNKFLKKKLDKFKYTDYKGQWNQETTKLSKTDGYSLLTTILESKTDASDIEIETMIEEAGNNISGVEGNRIELRDESKIIFVYEINSWGEQYSMLRERIINNWEFIMSRPNKSTIKRAMGLLSSMIEHGSYDYSEIVKKIFEEETDARIYYFVSLYLSKHCNEENYHKMLENTYKKILENYLNWESFSKDIKILEFNNHGELKSHFFNKYIELAPIENIYKFLERYYEFNSIIVSKKVEEKIISIYKNMLEKLYPITDDKENNYSSLKKFTQVRDNDYLDITPFTIFDFLKDVYCEHAYKIYVSDRIESSNSKYSNYSDNDRLYLYIEKLFPEHQVLKKMRVIKEEKEAEKKKFAKIKKAKQVKAWAKKKEERSKKAEKKAKLEKELLPIAGKLAKEQKNKGNLVVKGLYIGMEKKYAEALMNQKHKDVKQKIIISYKNDKIDHIFYDSSAIKTLFNSGNTPIKEFSQSFIEAYNIPELEPELTFEKGLKTITYRYTSMEAGWKIAISGVENSSNFSIFLLSVAKKSNLKMGD